MAKRKVTKSEMEAAIRAHGGNVLAIARALECTPQTVYNTLDRYGMRGDLEAARDQALEAARMVIARAPQRLQIALTMLAESTGGITKDDLIRILRPSESTIRE